LKAKERTYTHVHDDCSTTIGMANPKSGIGQQNQLGKQGLYGVPRKKKSFESTSDVYLEIVG